MEPTVVFHGVMNDGTRVRAYVHDLDIFLKSGDADVYVYDDTGPFTVSRFHVNWTGATCPKGEE